MATDPPGVLQRFPTGADLKEHACKQKALAFIFANSFGKGVTDFFFASRAGTHGLCSAAVWPGRVFQVFQDLIRIISYCLFIPSVFVAGFPKGVFIFQSAA